MDVINSVICADVIDGLKQIPDGIVTLICSSPPYNVDASHWKYATANDNQPYADYLKWLTDVFLECKRTLRSGGRIAINIDAMTNRQEDKDKEYIRSIDTDLTNIMKSIGMKYFAEFVWLKHQVVGRATAWGSWCSPSTPVVRRNHEYIKVFSKDTFTLSGDRENIDITPEEFTKFTISTWDIQPQTKKQCEHPAAFPEDIPYRLIKLYSYKDDIILDPFSGTGTTAYVASYLDRRYIGIDIDEKYCNYARERIEKGKTMM